MATKQDIQARGYNAYGTDETNPYKDGSWQSTAWIEGHARAKAEAGSPLNFREKLDADTRQAVEEHEAKQTTWAESNISPFPDRMPEPTREHIRCLDREATATRDSSRALHLDVKISKLYQRWA